MRTHLRHHILGWPACGIGRRHSQHARTDDPDEVTCRRCLLTRAWAYATRVRVAASELAPELAPEEAHAIRHALGYDSRRPLQAGCRNYYAPSDDDTIWPSLASRGYAVRGAPYHGTHYYHATEEGARAAGVLYAWRRHHEDA